MHLVRILAIVPHIIGARAEPVIVTLLQGCKRLSVVISYLRASIDDDFFPQRCFYVVESILVYRLALHVQVPYCSNFLD
mgnify:CR=1 FL=1